MATGQEIPKADNVLSDSATVPKWVDKETEEAKLRFNIRNEYEVLFKLWKEGELEEIKKEQDKVISEGIQKLFDKWVEEQKPPTHEDIAQLLNQDYETFPIQVHFLDDDGEEKSEMFTIRELPQSIEIEFYKSFQDRILKKVTALGAFVQTEIDRPFEEKAKAMLSLVGEGFDVIADAATLCLNPFGKKSHINRKWVQEHISSDRQWRICEAQMKVNRLKDFFSKVSQSGQTTQMMMGNAPRFQQLQQLVR